MLSRILLSTGLFVLGWALAAGLLPAAADQGMIVMTELKENIDIYEPQQKAILCWNRGTELMILSTDKHLSRKAKVLSFMPLPAKPGRVEQVDADVFESVSRLIEAHRPRVAQRDSNSNAKGHGADGLRAEEAVRVVFHEKIGAHDITIVEVRELVGFSEWVKKFYAAQRIPYQQEKVVKLQPLVRDYLRRGYGHFVFDVIELTEERKTVSPILYEFKSPAIYYPLVVSTLTQGRTSIALYMFTPGKTDIWGTRTSFVSGYYARGDRVDYGHPIKFEVAPSELASISPDLIKFMAGSPRVWFSAAKYEGATSKLTRDFFMKIRH
ncbi:MAG: DUF2330 domain-containing protein [Armatimonadetes bacterium]|nr:DUF2330 domain-containing protein [Armatimonadota bacterium]